MVNDSGGVCRVVRPFMTCGTNNITNSARHLTTKTRERPGADLRPLFPVDGNRHGRFEDRAAAVHDDGRPYAPSRRRDLAPLPGRRRRRARPGRARLGTYECKRRRRTHTGRAGGPCRAVPASTTSPRRNEVISPE